LGRVSRDFSGILKGQFPLFFWEPRSVSGLKFGELWGFFTKMENPYREDRTNLLGVYHCVKKKNFFGGEQFPTQKGRRFWGKNSKLGHPT